MIEKYSILYLDDEEQNLVSFQALFRRKYNVFTTTSAHEAVDILNKHAIHVIFSDQKMPDVSGVEFFETILPDFPQAVRILLTGYAEIEAVIDAINKGQVYRYVPKPWDANDLEVCVENAIEKYLREQELLRKSRELDQSNSAMEQLVFNAGKELRSPAEQILLLTQQLKAHSGDETALALLSKIDLEALRMKTFSEQIAQFLQNSKADLTIAEVNLNDLVKEVIESIPQERNESLWTIATELNLNGSFTSDAARIRTVLQNIVNNAVKYSDESKGQNSIQINVVQNSEKAVFRIADQGVGIVPDQLHQLFTMQFTSSHASGKGISLFVTKSVVDKMQGKISATSTPGQGTLITFEIPNTR
jgi:signal transduction histidine kinase